MTTNKINVDGLPGGAERITNIEQGTANVQVLWRSANDYYFVNIKTVGGIVKCFDAGRASILQEV
jgi:hypothetical protein